MEHEIDHCADPSAVPCVGLSIVHSMSSVHAVFYHVIHLLFHVLFFRSMWSVHAVFYHVIHLMLHVFFFMFHLSFHVVSSCGVLPCDPSDVACVVVYVPSFVPCGSLPCDPSAVPCVGLYVPSFVPCGQFMRCSTM